MSGTPTRAEATPRLPVVEIFGPTLQGEGVVIGLKTMFLRLAGCDWACAWCDTPYAWKPGELAPVRRMTPQAIRDELHRRAGTCRDLTITGGNPALHDLTELIRLLKADGWRIHVETQGTRAPAWLAQVDLVTFSPKPPSSGMPEDWEGLAAGIRLARQAVLKVVVFDDRDYEYARRVRRRFPHLPFVLQVGNRVGEDDRESLLARLAWLAERALADPELEGVRVLPQLHVLLWGNRRGV